MKHRSGSTRRHILKACTAVFAGLAGLTSMSAVAQAWPDKPVRIIVPYAAGQGADLLTRLVSQELSKMLNQPFIVENKAGAGGNIGTSAAARSNPDGYTFMLGTNATNAANEFLYENLGFNPGSDFDAVAMIGLLPMVIASTDPKFPTNGIQALIKSAQAKPDTLNVGLPSTTAHVVFAEFVRSAKAPLFGVKYKASAQSMADVLGQQIPLVIDTVTAARPHIDSGKLKALGITSLKASDMLPGVKPVAEQGVPGFDVVAWDALFAPKGTPSHIIEKMAETVQLMLKNPEVRKKMQTIGVEPLAMTSKQLDVFVKDERRKWGDIIKVAGIGIK